MLVHVLGSGAGGGFPQWNCNCRNCRGVRDGTVRARPRTQSSIAVSGDGTSWAVINASPDIRSQIDRFPALQPGGAVRATAIAGVVLMDSQIDHVTGLLSLRESKGLSVHCTEMVKQDLTIGFPVFTILQHYCPLHVHRIPLDGGDFVVSGVDHLRFSAVPLHSKAPPYSPHRHDPHIGDNIGLTITDVRNGRTLFYAPGLGRVDGSARDCLAAADCALIDGTFWLDDEMERAGISSKRATDMGHLPLSGPGGMMAMLKPLTKPRKILIHINNTNPILDEDSAERRELAGAGIEVAHDGMEISL